MKVQRILALILVLVVSSIGFSAEKCERELNEFIKHTKFKSWNPPAAEARSQKININDYPEGKEILRFLAENERTHTKYVKLEKEATDLENRLAEALKEDSLLTEKSKANMAVKKARLGLNEEYSNTVVALHQIKKEIQKLETPAVQAGAEMELATKKAQDKALISAAKKQLQENTEFQTYKKTLEKYVVLLKKEAALRTKLLPAKEVEPLSKANSIRNELDETSRSRNEQLKEIGSTCLEVFSLHETLEKRNVLNESDDFERNLGANIDGKCGADVVSEKWSVSTFNSARSPDDAYLARLIKAKLPKSEKATQVIYRKWTSGEKILTIENNNFLGFNFQINDNCSLEPTVRIFHDSCAKTSLEVGFRDDYLCRFTDKTDDNRKTSGLKK